MHDEEVEMADMVDDEPRRWASLEVCGLSGIGLFCVPCLAASAERVDPPAKGGPLCMPKTSALFGQKCFVRWE